MPEERRLDRSEVSDRLLFLCVACLQMCDGSIWQGQSASIAPALPPPGAQGPLKKEGQLPKTLTSFEGRLAACCCWSPSPTGTPPPGSRTWSHAHPLAGAEGPRAWPPATPGELANARPPADTSPRPGPPETGRSSTLGVYWYQPSWGSPTRAPSSFDAYWGGARQVPSLRQTTCLFVRYHAAGIPWRVQSCCGDTLSD